jgi:hypothetical protein
MLYIGNFLFVTNQQNTKENSRRHGGFNMVIDAPSESAALQKFRQRLFDYGKESSFFEGRCRIFLVNIMEFNHIPKKQAVMLSYKSFAGDPILPYIECAAPLAQKNACSIHEWVDNHPKTEGKEDQLFLEFPQEREI